MALTPTYLIKTLLTPPSVFAKVKKLANLSYLVILSENQRRKMLNSIRIILTDTPVLTIPTDHLLFGSEHLSVDKTHDSLTLF